MEEPVKVVCQKETIWMTREKRLLIRVETTYNVICRPTETSGWTSQKRLSNSQREQNKFPSWKISSWSGRCCSTLRNEASAKGKVQEYNDCHYARNKAEKSTVSLSMRLAAENHTNRLRKSTSQCHVPSLNTQMPAGPFEHQPQTSASSKVFSLWQQDQSCSAPISTHRDCSF